MEYILNSAGVAVRINQEPLVLHTLTVTSTHYLQVVQHVLHVFSRTLLLMFQTIHLFRCIYCTCHTYPSGGGTTHNMLQGDCFKCTITNSVTTCDESYNYTCTYYIPEVDTRGQLVHTINSSLSQTVPFN